MSASDECVFSKALQQPSDSSPVLKKEVLPVNDTNGGSYNGQINIDCSNLANSGTWLNYSEAYIEIPYIVTFSSSADSSAAGVVNGWILGLKNGTHQLVDSIQVSYNNSTVVQNTPFTNFYVGYKLMTTFSQDDLIKNGPGLIFNPDSAGSRSFSAAAALNGDGYSNSLVYPVSATPVWAGGATGLLDQSNSGFFERLKQTSYPLTTRDKGYGAIPNVNTAPLAAAIGKNYVTDSGAGVNRIWQFNILATIRLKDLCSFFENMPLVKGALIRMTINYNACSITETQAVGATQVIVTMSMRSGRTCPIMKASCAANNPSLALVSGLNTINCGVGQSVTGAQPTIASSVRLYVPSYTLSPAYEKELLAISPIREVRYTDIFQYSVSNVAVGASFNSILSNGIVNPKMVIVMPHMSAGTANTGLVNFTGPLYQSIYDSAPGTTAFAPIGQFNVLVSGKNVFQQNQAFDFQSFRDELQEAGAINGNLDSGLTSGLISQYMWDNAYRYYVANVGRRLPGEESVSKSISIQGVNNTTKIMDYVCFVTYEKVVKINMLTGALVEE